MSDKAGQSATIPNAIFKAMGPQGSPSIERDLAATGIAATQIRRMNLNESPYPPSAQAIAAMQAACSTVNYYPDPKWRDLVAAISGETGIAENRIVLGNGSDELIVNAGKIAIWSQNKAAIWSQNGDRIGINHIETRSWHCQHDPAGRPD